MMYRDILLRDPLTPDAVLLVAGGVDVLMNKIDDADCS